MSSQFVQRNESFTKITNSAQPQSDIISTNAKFVNLDIQSSFTTGPSNTFSGQDALISMAPINNTQAINNVAMGINALKLLSTGSDNTAIGADSLNNTTTGSNNVAIGSTTGTSLTEGSNNIIIGKNANVDPTLNNQVVIGRDVTGTVDNQIIIGQPSVNIAGTIVSGRRMLQINKTDTSTLKLLTSHSGSIVNINSVAAGGNSAIELTDPFTTGQYYHIIFNVSPTAGKWIINITNSDKFRGLTSITTGTTYTSVGGNATIEIATTAGIGTRLFLIYNGTYWICYGSPTVSGTITFV